MRRLRPKTPRRWAPLSTLCLPASASASPPGAADSLPPCPQRRDGEREQERCEGGGLVAVDFQAHPAEARPDARQSKMSVGFQPVAAESDPRHRDHSEDEQEREEDQGDRSAELLDGRGAEPVVERDRGGG